MDFDDARCCRNRNLEMVRLYDVYDVAWPMKGNARFSPIKDSDGASIPTLYGGTSFDCAVMETLFHDVASPRD
jgi:hypothetical protein